MDYSQAAESIWAYANGNWYHTGAAGVPYVRKDLHDAEISRLTAERDALRAEVEALRADSQRLDFLDRCNAALNMQSGTAYGWKMVMNHNVNRLMTARHHLAVDLNDAEPHGPPSCREAIDEEMSRVSAAHAARKEGE